MTTITAEEQMILEILRLVMNDTAAAQAAIEFIDGNERRYELFKDQWKHAGSECTSVSRAQKWFKCAKKQSCYFQNS